MSRSTPLDSNVSQPLDEAYWNALFKQEESEPKPAPEPPAEISADWSKPKQETKPQSRQPDAAAAPDDLAGPWLVAQETMDADHSLQLQVTGCNKGGLLVQWNGLQGFVPASQLVNFPQFHNEAERLQVLRKWINRRLELKIIELNRYANRLVLSERAALVEASQRERLLRRIKPGDRLEGHVTNLTDFGAFVDLGGVEGLIHISQLSWSRVNHPYDIVKPGQAVRVLVLSIDPSNGRVALSLKQLRINPWKDVEKRYRPGQLVEGIVSNVVHFGVFVQLEEELEGLIHISELAEGTFLHPRNVVQNGDHVVAQVLNVDGTAKRLALRLLRIRSENQSH
jgi:small subunit ribosomal protein S1